MGVAVRNFNHFSKTKQGTPSRGRLSNRFWDCMSHDCSEKFRIYGVNTKARVAESPHYGKNKGKTLDMYTRWDITV